ncbi:MAG TPA: hypothetical protein VIF62_26625, partial [Labilithrix sp.]
MLPFTKRPGREDGDEDVSTREDISPPGPGSIRPPKPSFSDDELTNLMPTKSLGDAISSARPPAPIPAAGRPATIPPPRSSNRPPASVPPPRSSARPQAMMDDEDDEGRTVVRGAPKIVKRGSKRPPQMDTKENVPTTLSPAAVIKQTLESAYAAKSERLMPPPPAELLPDPPDRHPADGPSSTVLMPPSARSQPPPMIQGVQAINLGLQQTIHGTPPSRPPPSAPHSYPPPPQSYPPSHPYSGAP